MKTKKIPLALVSAVISWMACLYIWGLGNNRSFTSSGQINPTDPNELYKALSDPTFQETVSWGHLTITQNTAFILSVVIPLLVFVIFLTLAFRKSDS